MDKNIFYDGSKSLSYNALFNFRIGARGLGKTYDAKRFVIRQFLKDGSQFGYLRRYERELKNNGKFFTDLIAVNEFPETELKTNGMTYSINGKDAGQAFILSTASSLKSVPYPNIKTLIFDEFLIDTKGIGSYHYLSDEVTRFLDFYETIARLRDVRVLFLSNAISVTNPYFLYFNLELPTAKSRIWRRGQFLVEYIENKAFADYKRKTKFGQIIEGTKYGNYAIENKFLRDNDAFIARKTQHSKYTFGFRFEGKTFGVWIDYQAGRMTVSDDVDPNAPLVYTLTQADHEPNTILLNQLSRSPLFKLFLDNYEQANVYFENMQVKNICYQVFKLFRIR